MFLGVMQLLRDHSIRSTPPKRFKDCICMQHFVAAS